MCVDFCMCIAGIRLTVPGLYYHQVLGAIVESESARVAHAISYQYGHFCSFLTGCNVEDTLWSTHGSHVTFTKENPTK